MDVFYLKKKHEDAVFEILSSNELKKFHFYDMLIYFVLKRYLGRKGTMKLSYYCLIKENAANSGAVLLSVCFSVR